jgi:hypothetical protein
VPEESSGLLGRRMVEGDLNIESTGSAQSGVQVLRVVAICQLQPRLRPSLLTSKR